MFAAIAIGVGVDFAVHLIDKLREALEMHDEDIHLAVGHTLPLTARACYFNSGALALGFSVLMTSDLPMLQRFGGLVTLAAVCSYLTALVLVPALFAAGRSLSAQLFKPALHAPGSAVAGLVLLLGLFVAQSGFAADAPGQDMDGSAIAAEVAAREEGAASRRVIDIQLTDRRGKVRERSALILKRAEADQRETRFTYLAPKSVYEVTHF